MPKISIDVGAAQLEKALAQLGAAEQWRLARRVATHQMDAVVAKLRRTVRQRELSPKTIDRIVTQARLEVAHRRRH